MASPARERLQRLGKDRGLQLRMFMTMFLLGLVYVGLIGLLFALGAGAVTMAVVAGLLLLFQYSMSDKIALATLGAREVTPAEEPLLHETIERLCIQADLPKPRVAVIESQMPNACALGRSPKAATVCATRGILELLSPAELEAVLAHEITHIINRDVAVMTLASFFASLAAMITQFAMFFGAFGGGYRSREEEEEVVLVMVVAAVVYLISFLLLQALSRYREYAADRGSALITMRPSALISALEKVSGHIEVMPTRDLRTAEGLSAFFIVPARAKESLLNLFSDHPPLEKRIAHLERIEAELLRAA
jgi:heat shock protein HtpX